MRRLLVNDALSQIEGTHTFWSNLQEWFDMKFFGGDYATLAETADKSCEPFFDPGLGVYYGPSLIIRNATYFGPLKASANVPTLSLLQDIITEGPLREMQEAVMRSSRVTVFNSGFTKSHYWTAQAPYPGDRGEIVPLPVDFNLFKPGNPMGLQQALSLPDGCVLWIGAHEGAAGAVKGWDIFLQIVRTNPDIHFVAVFKDSIPESFPPNMRAYCRLTQEEIVKVMGACRVGLCTSRTESQHLAGIEMGACGLPLVVTNVGTYWNRNEMMKPSAVGVIVSQPEPSAIASHLRFYHAWSVPTPEVIRWYWAKEFDVPVIKDQWTKLIEEIERAPSRS